MIPRQKSYGQHSFPRGLSVLGSTGSIGRQTLEIVRLFPDRFVIHALTAHSNVDLLVRQSLEFRPSVAVIADEAGYDRLCSELDGSGVKVLAGPEGLGVAAGHPEVDLVMAAMVGFAGLEPVLVAVRSGKTVALANKETLVVGGALVAGILEGNESIVIPVDSEHSAIFQCLVGEQVEDVEQLIITASGGPFRDRPGSTFGSITPKEALDHPNWSMGRKITIDSATMMNKGLEVIEARWLFEVPSERIRVVVHPQSIVHSLVVFRDGSAKAQLGVPDMKVPIQYALSFPERWPAPHDRIDWSQIGSLDFESPDFARFPCLRLAYEALDTGGTAPTVLNAANEVAVDLFLKGKVRFTDIPSLIEQCLERVAVRDAGSLESLREADRTARRMVKELNRSAVH